MPAPVLDEGGEELVVEAERLGAGVGFALVPEDAVDGERGEGRDHGVVETRGLARMRCWDASRGWG